MSTTNIDELAKQIHETATARGFWEEERNLGEMLMLVVSELAEALEEHRDNKDILYFVEGKPEGTVVELADAVIRCLDTLYSRWKHFGYGPMQNMYDDYRITQSVPTSAWPEIDNFGDALFHITRLVGRAHDNILWLMHVVVYCERVAGHLGGDIWQTAAIKMTYNDSRPYKHGKKY